MGIELTSLLFVDDTVFLVSSSLHLCHTLEQSDAECKMTGSGFLFSGQGGGSAFVKVFNHLEMLFTSLGKREHETYKWVSLVSTTCGY